MNAQENAREETLMKKNEELRQRLEEKSEQYEDAIREIEHLKDIASNAQENAHEETLKENEELRKSLEENSKQYEDAKREIDNLKDIIDKQVCNINQCM